MDFNFIEVFVDYYINLMNFIISFVENSSQQNSYFFSFANLFLFHLILVLKRIAIKFIRDWLILINDFEVKYFDYSFTLSSRFIYYRIQRSFFLYFFLNFFDYQLIFNFLEVHLYLNFAYRVTVDQCHIYQNSFLNYKYLQTYYMDFFKCSLCNRNYDN